MVKMNKNDRMTGGYEMKFGKGYWKTFQAGIEREWVITNGAGSYCGSSIIGANTRKHHGLLIASLHAPVQRYLILSKINESMQIKNHTYSFATNQRPGGWNEEGQKHLQRFLYDELPHFKYQVEDVFITKTIAFEHEKNTIAIGYEIQNGCHESTFSLVPLFNFRDHHERSERGDLRFTTSVTENTMQLTPSVNQEIKIKFYTSAGSIAPNRETYDIDMEYQTEINTGMSCIDNHYTPYQVKVELKPFEKMKLSVVCSLEEAYEKDAFATISNATNRIKALKETAGYQDEFADSLVQAADQFIVKRESTGYKTVLAGLPWFTDWGRDTMIALQGLTLVTKRYEDAKGILKTFAQYVKNGLVPNMFPDEGLEPLYNTVDASLWYFYSVDQYLEHTGKEEDYQFVEEFIYPKLEEIIESYKNGTDFSIGMDQDGLIHAGGGLDQVTWMDVRVGEWVVTPRHGKPVEINALWYNALKVMEKLGKRLNKKVEEYSKLADQVKATFQTTFWNEDKQCLFDVVSEEGNDAKIRPNQIWAVSLPFTLLEEEKAKKVVNTVISELYASYGLRSLSPEDPEYIGLYKGQLHDRDAAYHQGTTWGFPLGGLVTAYVKVHKYSKESLIFAKQLLEPIEDHLRDGCVGSIAEIFDGEEPIISRGCYAQAWSVGEVLRAYVEDVLLPLKSYKES